MELSMYLVSFSLRLFSLMMSYIGSSCACEKQPNLDFDPNTSTPKDEFKYRLLCSWILHLHYKHTEATEMFYNDTERLM